MYDVSDDKDDKDPQRLQVSAHPESVFSVSFAQVNAYIRSRDHIDVAASFENGGDLPTELALDGIHGDWNMKQEMAQVINEGMKRFGV